ncbi:MAG: acyl-CoA dehydrogenase family protein, partial [Gammaproteobacteria bacterium]|nr:acyl-CoA dehydrogenase family protein [Gammaproteobacteria bacterium]
MKRFIPFSKSAVNHYLVISNKNTAINFTSTSRLERARGPRKVPEKPLSGTIKRCFPPAKVSDPMHVQMPLNEHLELLRDTVRRFAELEIAPYA